MSKQRLRFYGRNEMLRSEELLIYRKTIYSSSLRKEFGDSDNALFRALLARDRTTAVGSCIFPGMQYSRINLIGFGKANLAPEVLSSLNPLAALVYVLAPGTKDVFVRGVW
ncbi:hypothetical protein BOTNAR_0058g00340 [Botryotinia narcissicola]|uniref:Uncharacterized protein n=1 Tax=Botryotinia narcissicola TaxID=278944 RepID=A0A4Z1IYP2_9HELO|nr:hypothetical protein BOTNAR_0058g00340 [Botryotinia narcissicola]